MQYGGRGTNGFKDWRKTLRPFCEQPVRRARTLTAPLPYLTAHPQSSERQSIFFFELKKMNETTAPNASISNFSAFDIVVPCHSAHDKRRYHAPDRQTGITCAPIGISYSAPYSWSARKLSSTDRLALRLMLAWQG